MQGLKLQSDMLPKMEHLGAGFFRHLSLGALGKLKSQLTRFCSSVEYHEESWQMLSCIKNVKVQWADRDGLWIRDQAVAILIAIGLVQPRQEHDLREFLGRQTQQHRAAALAMAEIMDEYALGRTHIAGDFVNSMQVNLPNRISLCVSKFPGKGRNKIQKGKGKAKGSNGKKGKGKNGGKKGGKKGKGKKGGKNWWNNGNNGGNNAGNNGNAGAGGAAPAS
jgi:hypothetical protein